MIVYASPTLGKTTVLAGLVGKDPKELTATQSQIKSETPFYRVGDGPLAGKRVLDTDWCMCGWFLTKGKPELPWNGQLFWELQHQMWRALSDDSEWSAPHLRKWAEAFKQQLSAFKRRLLVQLLTLAGDQRVLVLTNLWHNASHKFDLALARQKGSKYVEEQRGVDAKFWDYYPGAKVVGDDVWLQRTDILELFEEDDDEQE